MLIGLTGCLRGGYSHGDLGADTDARSAPPDQRADVHSATPDQHPDQQSDQALVPWTQLQLSSPHNVSHLNSASRDRTVSLSADGLVLYLASDRSGGAGGFDLMVTERSHRAAAFGAPTPLTALNTPHNEWSAALSPSQHELLFVRDDEMGDQNLWRAVWASDQDAFGAPELVVELNTEHDDLWPVFINEHRLLFVTDRPGGIGRTDIWQADRPAPDAPFGTPSPVAPLNSTAHDWEVTISADERAVIIASNRQGTMGSGDLWLATRSARSEPFSTPVLLPTLNSPYDEADPVLSSDGTELYFCSNRPGGQGGWDIYRSAITFP